MSRICGTNFVILEFRANAIAYVMMSRLRWSQLNFRSTDSIHIISCAILIALSTLHEDNLVVFV